VPCQAPHPANDSGGGIGPEVESVFPIHRAGISTCLLLLLMLCRWTADRRVHVSKGPTLLLAALDRVQNDLMGQIGTREQDAIQTLNQMMDADGG
jgi:hypothetical protein